MATTENLAATGRRAGGADASRSPGEEAHARDREPRTPPTVSDRLEEPRGLRAPGPVRKWMRSTPRLRATPTELLAARRRMMVTTWWFAFGGRTGTVNEARKRPGRLGPRRSHASRAARPNVFARTLGIPNDVVGRHPSTCCAFAGRLPAPAGGHRTRQTGATLRVSPPGWASTASVVQRVDAPPAPQGAPSASTNFTYAGR